MKSIRSGIILAFTLLGCSTTAPKLERALIGPEDLDSVIRLDSILSARTGIEKPDNENGYKVKNGTKPFVLISAPHSLRPFRDGKYRFSDGGGTAALANLVGDSVGATVIYKVWEDSTDPNYSDKNDYKSEFGRILDSINPKIVLDIHGSHPRRSYDIDIGTMNDESIFGNRNIIYKLIEELNKSDLNSISYNYFPASKNSTITKYAKNKGYIAIQLEINSNWVSPSKGDIEVHQFSKLSQALIRFLRSDEIKKIQSK